MIIGFSGLKGSGKDTAGAYLVKQHGFERRAFADPLKQYISAVFDIDIWDIEKFKNEDNVFAAIGYKNSPTAVHLEATGPNGDWVDITPNNMWSPISELSFRDLVRNIGEKMKPILGEDVWVNKTLPVGGYYAGRKIVITDVRFEVERQRIKDLGGWIVRIAKTRVDEEVADEHISEAGQLNLPYDYWIENLGSYDLLYKEVERMLEVLV